MCSCDFEVNHTNIKGGFLSGRKVVPHDSKSDLPLVIESNLKTLENQKWPINKDR